VDFFDICEVEQYLSMSEGYDGVELIKILQKYLPKNSTVLEIGMESRKYMDILKKIVTVTGSDNSQIFLNKYKENDPTQIYSYLTQQLCKYYKNLTASTLITYYII